MVFILGKGHILILFLFIKLFSQHKRRNILRVLQRRKLLLFDICIREKVSTFWQDFQVGSLANITTSSSSYKTIHIDGGNFRKRKMEQGRGVLNESYFVKLKAKFTKFNHSVLNFNFITRPNNQNLW